MKIPFITKPWYTTDEYATNEASGGLYDCVLEQKPGGGWLLSKRPGLQEICDPGTNKPGQGCHYSEKLDAFFFVSDGKLWKYENTGVTVTLIGSGLSTTNNIIFAEGQNLDSSAIIYLADGGVLRYTNGTTLTTVTDVTAPTNATFVAWFSNRFVANSTGSNYFYATGVNPATSLFDNTYWSSAFNPFAAEVKGDDVTAIHSFSGELWVSGEEGIEIWQDDGATPFVTLQTSFLETGAIAPYSITRIDLSVYALVKLQGELMVCRYDSRNPTPISQAISRPLNSLTNVRDAIGFHLFTGGISFFVLTFPSEGITYAWDIKNEYWMYWGTWMPETGAYDLYEGQHSAYASKWGQYLVQSRLNSKIYAVSRDYYSDANNMIRAYYLSPSLDHGTLKRKKCREMILYTKQLPGNNTGTKQLTLKWNNEGRAQWSNEIFVSVDLEDQYSNIVRFKQLGVYRNRRYALTMADYCGYMIGDCEMDVEALRD